MTDAVTPGVYQILDGTSTAEQKFRTNTIGMTDEQRQYGVVMVEVQEDDTPYSTVTGTSINLDTGKAYFCSISSSLTTFVLPTISDNREDKLHTILLQFETHTGASIAFTSSGGSEITCSGETPALNGHYTASCMYRKYWNTSSQETDKTEWKWVVTITEDTV